MWPSDHGRVVRMVEGQLVMARKRGKPGFIGESGGKAITSSVMNSSRGYWPNLKEARGFLGRHLPRGKVPTALDFPALPAGLGS
ncbi:hypothetical protein DPMN_040415 [Dreissena polymorpha]|uniref:Uncharacterized protein n=1 Tax=Dreissena polymorpha TaxID=45954 RepID=A0A9D4HWV4_DREPO|nr:hypothetical protein DPMN_040415 [Dreissena polymorpha]